MAVTVEEKMQPHRLQQMRLKKQCTEAKAKIKIRLVYGFPDQSYIFEQPTLNFKKKKKKIYSVPIINSLFKVILQFTFTGLHNSEDTDYQ